MAVEVWHNPPPLSGLGTGYKHIGGVTPARKQKNILKDIAIWKQLKSQEEIGESLETIQLYRITHWDLPFPMAFKCDL